jgi:hypothetical protein
MKTWPRRLAIAAAVLIVLVLAALAVARWWGQRRLAQATAQFEQTSGPLDPSRFLLPEVPDEDNAATWLMAGAQAIVIPEVATTAWNEGLEVRIDEWTPEILSSAESLIESNEPGFELLTRALPLEESTFGIHYDEGVDAEIPPLIELWRAARLIRLDARLAMLEGDRDRVSRGIALLDRLSRSLLQESFLISALIALSTERLILDTTLDVVRWPETDRALILDLQTRVAALDPIALLRRALCSEATLAATTSLGKRYSGDVGFLVRQQTRFVEPFMAATLLEGYMEMSSLLAEPFATIREYYFSKDGLPAWNVYGILLPNLLDAIGRAKAIETGQVLALEALRLRLVCLQTGTYPTSLGIEIVEPFAGGPILIERAPEGGLDLAAPLALALWSELYEGGDQVKPPPLTWRLPACSNSEP